ncbi:MAG: UDP-3-O-(3-hydroxymyristoyl)glucosamine N-acyltransferase [Bacteroidales bacterium]|nr:UDP-3-O-(3-hydroxymyristoyl)glucosamine N-acyltransferase [Bacteroidales bacterium]
MEFTAKSIAEILDGKVDGNPNVVVSNVSKIENGEKGTLSFLANLKYSKYIYSTNASIVIVNKNFVPEKNIDSTLIRVDDAYQAFASLLEFYNLQRQNVVGISDQSFVDESAKLGKDVYVGAFAYIGKNVEIGNNVKIYPQVYIGENVKIKDNTILNPGVKIYRDCKIGANCIIHASVIIGSDGFGFAPKNNCDYIKVPQVGDVVIENNVEIGANTTIDRATLGSTIIREGVKLDNLIQVAHNVEIDKYTVIAALSGISGSTKIGKNCMIGGQVGFVGHAKIADNVKIAAQSGIGGDIKKEGIILQGSPAYNIYDYQKSFVIFKQLPDIAKKIINLEKEIEELKKKLK